MRPVKILLLGAALASVSCQTEPTPENMAKAAALLNPRREASLSYWKDKTLHGRPALEFPPLVTAIVLPLNVRTTYKMTTLPDGVQKFEIVVAVKGTFFAGSAVPLTHDGYYLTAAHCVENGRTCTLVAPASNETLRTVPARVVWSGGSNDGEPDLALLHAPLRPHTILTMAPMESLRASQPVLTSGYGSNGFPNLEQGASGGRLKAIGKPRETPGAEKWLRFSHTAPLAAGDSGGPVIGEDGKLMGINTGFYGAAIFPFGLNQIWRYCGLGSTADPVWIQSLIKEDRDRRKKR